MGDLKVALQKKIYFKLWNGLRNIIIKIGLYDFAHKVYAFIVSLSHIGFERQRKKRANGWVDKRYIKIRDYKNKHEGKRCFIVCTGPSLTIEDVNRLKGEYTFGMNSIFKIFDKTDWRPTYYTITDPMVFSSFGGDPNFRSLRNRFLSSVIVKQTDPLDTDVVFPSDLLGFIKYGAPVDFSDDLYSVVYYGATVTYDIMQIAAYMGFKEIYLLGCDCNYSGEKKHFDEYNAPKEVINFEPGMIESYKVAKKYCDAHGIKIRNATRGGKLEVFERVGFDSLFDDR